MRTLFAKHPAGRMLHSDELLINFVSGRLCSYFTPLVLITKFIGILYHRYRQKVLRGGEAAFL